MFLVFQKRERCNTHTHRRGDDDDDKGRSMFLSEVYFVLCIPSLSPPPNFLFLREKNNIEREADAVEASRFFFQFLFQNKF